MGIALTIEDHPLLDAGAFITRFDQPLAALPQVDFAAAAPLATDDAVKTAVRDLLRAGGFKPAGRSKPASEYLSNAAALPRINAAVDACNLVSLHSGLPISVVDLDLLQGARTIRVAPAGTAYVFNPSGQTIDASHLLALYDEVGPSGTPVKDAQRTKTHPGTRATLSIVWGTRALPGRSEITTRWYREVLERLGGVHTEA